MDFDWINDERGRQVRLVQVIRGETSTQERYIDALTIGRQPQGHNILFTGLDLRQGGSVQVFFFDPRSTRIPTEDFSATFRDLPAGTTTETLRRDLPFVGIIPLLRPRPAEATDDIIFIEMEEEGPRVPPAYLIDVPFLMIRRTD